MCFGGASTIADAPASTRPQIKGKTNVLRHLPDQPAADSPMLPEVPTVAETGLKGAESISYRHLAPAGTPRARDVRCAEETMKVAKRAVYGLLSAAGLRAVVGRISTDSRKK